MRSILSLVGASLLMCGTAAEITPIRSVDGKQVGTGKAGRVTLRLQELFLEPPGRRGIGQDHHRAHDGAGLVAERCAVHPDVDVGAVGPPLA